MHFWLAVLTGLGGTLILVSPLKAQPALIDAFPAPDSILAIPPNEIRLTFDRALAKQGTEIRVTDDQGRRVDQSNTHIDPANRFILLLSIPPLIDGRYTVTYTASPVGSSIVLIGNYTFTVDLPPPKLALVTPVNGEAYEAGPIPLKMETEFFNFGFYDNRIRIYVDGILHSEVRALEVDVEGLEPGVHEIKTVLAQFEDHELSETAITVYVAVAQPDPESEGRARAAIAPPDPGMHLAPLELFLTIGLTGLLLGGGIWLGRSLR